MSEHDNPWPDWLASLSPAERVRAIIGAVAECHEDHGCGGSWPDGHRIDPETDEPHLLATEAVPLLLRLLGEARAPGAVAPAPDHAGAHVGLTEAQWLEQIGRTAGETVSGLGNHKDRPLEALAEIRDCVATWQHERLIPLAHTVPGPESAAVRPAWAQRAPLNVAVAALERLALDEVMFFERDLVDFDDPLAAERAKRTEYAKGALETIARLGAAGNGGDRA